MDPATRQLIEALHRAPHKCVLALTGGGSGALAQLLEVPGGSGTILEAVVPYHELALAEFLGQIPAHCCSAETSQGMARRALARAAWLAPTEAVLGLGATASLATARPKRGDHRFHVSVACEDRLLSAALVLTKGARTRAEEEAILDAVILNVLAEASQLCQRLALPLLAGEQLVQEQRPVGLLPSFQAGKVEVLQARLDGRLAADSWPIEWPPALLPGAFNPVHQGHWQLAAAASRLLGRAVAFELSVTNVDKPELTLREARRRLAQFTWRGSVWLTRAPTFVQKSLLFPGAVFVVGVDTAERILAPRYYQGGEPGLAEGIATIRQQGCHFLVAGRVDGSGHFRSLEDLDIPASCRALFAAIPQEDFQVDISSTELRKQSPGSLAAGLE